MSFNTRESLKKHGIRLVKSLGQNFLNDQSVVKEIVNAADVTESDLVMEVGPGIGNMTCELAKKAGQVIAVEIDRHLMEGLKENLQEFQNVKIINEDILKVDIQGIIDSELSLNKNLTSVKVVANLPYYITTPIIMKFLEDHIQVDKMVFMVQKEVAHRMVAKPGGKDYGALTVAVQYYSDVKIAFNVPPECFIPKPEVDSTVIMLEIYKVPPVSLLDKATFFRTVKASFGQRRKTLLNALSNSNYFNLSKEDIRQILENEGIEEKRRGETLSILQFGDLSNSIYLRK